MQKEGTWYAEGIYDHSLFTNQGLFTGGISYRKKEIRDAPIWDGYLPDYLIPENSYFLPGLTKEEYNTHLGSLFAQYSHKIDNLDIWMGIRCDNHDSYQDHTSFNTGMVWSPSSVWILKMLYGTAYRTPFARQLLDDEKPDLENIESLNFQIAFIPVKSFRIELSPFYSRIDNHIMEDTYAGLSYPNHQDIIGTELDIYFSPQKSIDLSANLTLTHNDGPDERYKYYDYTFFRPDGTMEKYYSDLSYPFDSGPDTLFNFTAAWRPDEKLSANLHCKPSLFLRIGYFSSTRLIFPRSEVTTTSSTKSLSLPGVWIADMCDVPGYIFNRD